MALEQKNTANITTRLPVLVKKLNQCLTISQETVCRKHGLTLAEAALISVIEPDRKLCSTALMERQELSKGRISRIVESLNRKGYLIKVEHRDDRRHNIIELTDQGRAVRQAIVEEQAVQCRRVLAYVPEDRYDAILPVLEQLVEALERAKHEGEITENR